MVTHTLCSRSESRSTGTSKLIMASPIGQRDMAPSNSLPSTTPRRGAQDKLPALDEYDAWPSSSAATSTTASTTDFVDCRDRDDGKTRTLTVKQTAKINKAMEQKVPDRIGASKIVTLFKWIGTIVCGCMLLGSLVYSKLSIIILSRKLNETNVDEEGTPSGESTRCFLMLVLLLLVPNVFNFFRAVWVAGFRKDFPWPKRTSMLLVSFYSDITIRVFIECLCFNTSLLLFKVIYLPKTPSQSPS